MRQHTSWTEHRAVQTTLQAFTRCPLLSLKRLDKPQSGCQSQNLTWWLFSPRLVDLSLNRSRFPLPSFFGGVIKTTRAFCHFVVECVWIVITLSISIFCFFFYFITLKLVNIVGTRTPLHINYRAKKLVIILLSFITFGNLLYWHDYVSLN